MPHKNFVSFPAALPADQQLVVLHHWPESTPPVIATTDLANHRFVLQWYTWYLPFLAALMWRDCTVEPGPQPTPPALPKTRWRYLPEYAPAAGQRIQFRRLDLLAPPIFGIWTPGQTGNTPCAVEEQCGMACDWWTILRWRPAP